MILCSRCFLCFMHGGIWRRRSSTSLKKDSTVHDSRYNHSNGTIRCIYTTQCLTRSVHRNMCSATKISAPPDLLLIHSPLNRHAVIKSPDPKRSYTAQATDLREGSPVSPTNTTTHLTEQGNGNE